MIKSSIATGLNLPAEASSVPVAGERAAAPITYRWQAEFAVKCRSKLRPRVTRTGHAYMPAGYQKSKADFGWLVKAARPPFTAAGDVALYVEIGVKAKGRGDDDNYLGWLMDSLQGIVFADDRQARVHALHPDGRIVRRNTGRDYIRLAVG